MTQAPSYLTSLPAVRADFVTRISGVPVDTDREATVARLRPAHEEAVKRLGFKWSQLHLAEQVHGAEVAIVKKGEPAQIWAGVDGLITTASDVLLGIYVADCGAVYISDPIRGVIALLHSGKKGTEGNITGRAIAMMEENFGSDPKSLHVSLAPCIRPPEYEIDFAAQIRQQVVDAGVPLNQYVDSGICTAQNVEDYYSYRVEKGSTGRMLALLGRG